VLYGVYLIFNVNNTSDGLSILATCTNKVRQWYLQNGLQLNTKKSEALLIGTANLQNIVTLSVSVAGVILPLAEEMKVLGVVLDRCLTFEKCISMWLDPASTTF